MGRPLTIVMDVTERCNLSCVMCYFSSVDRLQFKPFDRNLSQSGNMPQEVFDQVADTFFRDAKKVALGCAAEPLIHPRFADLVKKAGEYDVPNIWFPTNLLALTREKAEAIVESGVRTVAVSMDGTDAETYEKIRVGGKWELFTKRLELLNEVRKGSRTGLRFIYTWMKSNRQDLRNLPAFAESWGAEDLDVRFVAPTTGVDNTPELLDDEPDRELHAELAAVAEDAVDRGLKLAYYPEFHFPDDGSRNPFKRLRRALWRRKAGLYRKEYLLYQFHKWLDGCAFPKRTYVIRPNGNVSPCIFWEDEPMGVLPEGDLDDIDARIAEIRHGLRCGEPKGSCATCEIRRDAFYQPLRKPPEADVTSLASGTG